jgi:hypothetical protein
MAQEAFRRGMPVSFMDHPSNAHLLDAGVHRNDRASRRDCPGVRPGWGPSLHTTFSGMGRYATDPIERSPIQRWCGLSGIDDRSPHGAATDADLPPLRITRLTARMRRRSCRSSRRSRIPGTQRRGA